MRRQQFQKNLDVSSALFANFLEPQIAFAWSASSTSTSPTLDATREPPGSRRRPSSPLRGGRCTWRPHVLFSGDAWTLTGSGHENKSREQESVAREPAARIFDFFHDRMTRQWRAFFLRYRAVATAVAIG